MNTARKKTVNLTVSTDLLRQAKMMKLNMSRIMENALKQAIKQQLRTEWLEENQKGIEEYNEHVKQHGLFSDDIRKF